jgi:hypothetical protein
MSETSSASGTKVLPKSASNSEIHLAPPEKAFPNVYILGVPPFIFFHKTQNTTKVLLNQVRKPYCKAIRISAELNRELISDKP